MQVADLPRKVIRGLPYLKKEVRAIISDHTPLFVAVPRTVHIWRSAPCNAKCIMCEYGYLRGEAYTAISRIKFNDEGMSRAIDQVADLCGRGTIVSYIGGEPTVSPKIVEWVRQASSLGVDFRFTTNGYRIDKKMAAALIDAGVFNLGISLESLNPAINEIIRPHPNGTQKTIDAIEFLREERARQKKHTSLNIKTVITNLNMESFVEIIRRWGKADGMMCTPQMFEWNDSMPKEIKDQLCVQDIPRLEKMIEDVRKLKAEGYTVHVSEQGMSEMLKLAREDTDRSKVENRNRLEMSPDAPMCNIGTDNMWIQDGVVKLCPYHPPIGDMNTETRTLKEMWHNEITRKVREGTRACRRLCTISCLRRTPLKHKVGIFLKIA
jgi:sulfatase maturation enzyme AslB (radical SAM superfamily)